MKPGTHRAFASTLPAFALPKLSALSFITSTPDTGQLWALGSHLAILISIARSAPSSPRLGSLFLFTSQPDACILPRECAKLPTMEKLKLPDLKPAAVICLHCRKKPYPLEGPCSRTQKCRHARDKILGKPKLDTTFNLDPGPQAI